MLAAPATQAELLAWCGRSIALLESNVAGARRNRWPRLVDDYELELARWRAVRALLEGLGA